MKASDFFALPASLAHFSVHFPGDVAPWDWLKRIGPALAAHKFDGALPARPPRVKQRVPRPPAKWHKATSSAHNRC